jgi:hypothetical protein
MAGTSPAMTGEISRAAHMKKPAKCDFCALATTGDLQGIYKQSADSLFRLGPHRLG